MLQRSLFALFLNEGYFFLNIHKFSVGSRFCATCVKMAKLDERIGFLGGGNMAFAIGYGLINRGIFVWNFYIFFFHQNEKFTSIMSFF